MSVDHSHVLSESELNHPLVHAGNELQIPN